MQCKKLIRCNNVCEEHASYCVSHKKAHEPKKYCEAVINGTHQCSNYARKGDNKCAFHGPARAKLTITAFVVEGCFRLPSHIANPLNPKIRELLLQEWEKCKTAKGITPVSEKFVWHKTRGFAGRPDCVRPQLQIRLEKGFVPSLKSVSLEAEGKDRKVEFWAYDK